jgi:hypothetical protein
VLSSAQRQQEKAKEAKEKDMLQMQATWATNASNMDTSLMTVHKSLGCCLLQTGLTGLGNRLDQFWQQWHLKSISSAIKLL